MVWLLRLLAFLGSNISGFNCISYNRICFVNLIHNGRIGRHHSTCGQWHSTGCCLEFFDAEIWADQGWVTLDTYGHSVAGFDLTNVLALLVHQEIGDANRATDQNFTCATAGTFFFDLAQNRQGQIVIRPDQTRPVTRRTRLCSCLKHTGAQTLARHFHQTKTRDTTNLNAGAICLQLVFHPLFNGSIVAAFVHINKVDDDQTCQIAQTQLTGNFFGSFKIGFHRSVFNRTLFGRPTRVDIDRHQRFGNTDHDITTRFQLNRRIEHARKIGFHLETGKQRQRIFITFHVFSVRRHDHLHEVFGDAISAFTLNKHLVDFAIVQIADRTFDQIAFFVNLRRCDRFQCQLADLFPHTLQVFIIALDLGFGAFGTRRAHNQTSTLWYFDFVGDLFQFLTVWRVGDLAGNAAATGRVWHQDAITTGQR